MKMPKARGEKRETRGKSLVVASRRRPHATGLTSAFTLIEVMVVVAIMGVIMAMSLPSLIYSFRKDSVRKAAADLAEACGNARARAIMNGSMSELVFHPKEGRFEVGGTAGAEGDAPKLSAGSGLAGVVPEDVKIEMLDVNLREYKDEEIAHVRFFPNGTSDEMTVVFHSNRDEWRKVSLEVTTGLADVQVDMRK